MRPEQQPAIPINPHMLFSNLMQTSILNILIVVIMMRMTYASYMKFYENVDMSMLWSIWSPWWNERDATATTAEMVPQQHSDDSTIQWDTGAKEQVCGCAQHARDGEWSRILGVPHDGGMANEERAKTIRSRCKTRASHTTHKHSVHGGRSRRLYLRSVHFGAVQNRRGK